ncbi:MAG: hypothetical protein J5601_04550 [Elusimicrobiaceae bacterium]|nr:hypothetical protein [Elusimicrobiaceae bacterium]
MAEQQVTPEMIAQVLKQTMGQVNNMMPQASVPAMPQQGQSMMPAPMPAQTPQMGNMLNPTGWSVPIETDMNGMTVTVYVQFPAHTFPQYQQIIAMLLQMGYQVRGFQKNSGGWGGNGGNYQNRGGWGSYGRGGGYGRKW